MSHAKETNRLQRSVMQAPRLAHAVVDEIYGQAAFWADDAVLPDKIERLHHALWLFLERTEREPFGSQDAAVAWIWATYANLGKWRKPGPLPLDSVAAPASDLTGRPVPDRRSVVTEPPAEDPDATEDDAPATVILSYFATPSARHTGRLSLTSQEVDVIKAVAEHALSNHDHTVSTDAYALISDELGVPVEKIKKVYYEAKRAFARIYYVLGALGPPGVFATVASLDSAMSAFRRDFRGQQAWSILSYAARSALPRAEYASVDPDAYDASIHTSPPQALRLGWPHGTDRPSDLLHSVEVAVAAVFRRRTPQCVFSAHSSCPLCGAASDRSIP